MNNIIILIIYIHLLFITLLSSLIGWWHFTLFYFWLDEIFKTIIIFKFLRVKFLYLIKWNELKSHSIQVIPGTRLNLPLQYCFGEPLKPYSVKRRYEPIFWVKEIMFFYLLLKSEENTYIRKTCLLISCLSFSWKMACGKNTNTWI